jgi:hypothetical protein
MVSASFKQGIKMVSSHDWSEDLMIVFSSNGGAAINPHLGHLAIISEIEARECRPPEDAAKQTGLCQEAR